MVSCPSRPILIPINPKPPTNLPPPPSGPHKLDAHFVKAVRAMKSAASVWGDADQFYEKAAVKFVREFEGWRGFGTSEDMAESEREKRPGSPT
jgi:hypothetical protein